MDYITAKQYIESLTGRGISPGLESLSALLELIDNPERELNIIHIAGTNGKGSFGAYLSSILCTAHKKTARFVSPATGDYMNTFLIDNRPADKAIFANCVQKIKKAVDTLETTGIYPTSFEAETAIAFELFKSLSTDYVILECGMGGRLDATNVIPPPLLSVITKISYDHTAFLGNTLAEIATEKAGIIKSGSKTVSFIHSKEANDVIVNTAKERNVPLYFSDAPENIHFESDKTHFNLSSTRYTTKMLGAYQPENASLAIKAAEILGIPQKYIEKGIAEAFWEFRFERIGKFILDGAHNPDGAEALAKSLSEYSKNNDTAFITACFKDKDYKNIVKKTAPFAAKAYCLTAPSLRGLSSDILRDEFISHGTEAVSCKKLEEAIFLASKHKSVVIFGTLSILADAKLIIERAQ